MQVDFETTINESGGSSIIVIPSMIMKTLELKKGDKIVWVIDMSGEGPLITLYPKDKRFSFSINMEK